MRKFVLFIITICIPAILAAQPQQVSMDEAITAAFARIKSQTSVPVVKLIDIAFLRNQNDDTLLYEIETDHGLTVLLSGSKACRPILAIHDSEEGFYLHNYDDLPCGIQFFLESYKEQVDSCFHRSNIVLYHKDDWEKLINGSIPNNSRSNSVSPLLSSNWRQNYSNNNVPGAYNYLIPGNSQCDHFLAGCVAVAMGQVMYYWKYPVINSMREVQFDWCNMTDNLYTYEPTFEENRDAISFLLSECGQSVNMVYGCDGSSASSSDAADALIDDYLYHEDLDYKRKMWYSDETWRNMITDDLDNGWPIIYGGYGTLLWNRGHAFVCDGYNEYNEFHFNWGKSQFYNNPSNFFTLDSLAPYPNNYHYYQDAILGIRPGKKQKWCNTSLDLTLFYQSHITHNHPIYTCTPQTATKLISASTAAPSTWRTIPVDATVSYKAHEEIHLQDGFSVERGAEFTAQIVPCANCENNRGVEDQSIVETGNEQEESVPDMAVGRPSVTTEGLRAETVLYPNPTDGDLTMNVDGEVQSIVIYNAMGRPIGGWKLHAITPDHVTLDINPLATGTYLLLITTTTGSRTAKFIKQ